MKKINEKYVPVTVKSKNGVSYTKYKKVLHDKQAEILHRALTNTL